MKKLWEEYGWIVAILAIALPSFGIGTTWNDNTVARQQAEIDSLKAVRTKEPVFDCTEFIDSIVAIGHWRQSEWVKGFTPIRTVIYTKPVKKWPPDTLKHRPMRSIQKQFYDAMLNLCGDDFQATEFLRETPPGDPWWDSKDSIKTEGDSMVTYGKDGRRSVLWKSVGEFLPTESL